MNPLSRHVHEEYSPGRVHGVSDVVIVDDAPSDSASRLPQSRTIKFTTNGLKFTLYLKLTSVWADDIQIISDGPLEVVDRSYRGSGTIKRSDGETETIQIASVTFHEQDPEDVFHAVMHSENDQYTVEPKRAVSDELRGPVVGSSTLAFSEPDMYMWSNADLGQNDATSEGDAHVDGSQTNSNGSGTGGRRLLMVEKWEGCYNGQGQAIQEIKMGMLVDNGYFNLFGSNAATRDNIAEIMSDTNAMFNAQMDVEIKIANLFMGNNVEGFTFNEAPTVRGRKTCPSQMGASSRLGQLRAWRARFQPTTNGLWHLMTDCHPPPGTIGIAYVGALCREFGVGLSSNTGRGTWQTVAHELGHNFGSGHTFDVVNTGGINGGIMDYGDGIYNGEYQFHPVHEGEVCREITSSMTRRRTVPICWAAKTNPTPAPVTTPVANPTREPTRRTPRPAANPTGAPTIAEDRFQWQRGELTDCNPPCLVDYDGDGDAFSYATVRANCVDTDTGMEVEDYWCTGAGEKPFFGLAPCTAGNSGIQTCASIQSCGDGVRSPGETCDASAFEGFPEASAAAQQCCLNNCSEWSDSDECMGLDPTIDAGFMASDGRVWVFQGRSVAVFADFQAVSEGGNPLPGYPRPIAGTIPGLNRNFERGITAAAAMNDMTALLIKGDQYVVVDLEEGQTSAGVQNLNDLPGMNNAIAGCAQIDAAVSFRDRVTLVCGGVAMTYTYGVSSANWRTIDAEFQDVEFPAAVDQNQINAAIRDRTSGAIKFFKGGMNVEWYSSATRAAAQPTPGLGASLTDADTCRVENCQTCNESNVERCDVCESGFRRRRRGRRCKPQRGTIVDIDFDSQDWSTQICSMFYPPERCSTDDLSFAQMNIGAPTLVKGDFDQGGLFQGNERTPLTPYCKTTNHWKISFRWKPDSSDPNTDDPVRFFTIRRDRGNGLKEDFVISFDHDFIIENQVTTNQFVIHVDAYGSETQCFVNTPITADQWNKITVEFRNGILTTTANGESHTTAFQVNGPSDDMSVDFCDWWLGDEQNGIRGVVDNIEVSNLEQTAMSTEEEEGLEAWELGAIVIGALVGLCLCLVLAYRIKKAKGCSIEGYMRDDTRGMEGMPRPPKAPK